jgi:hypothetical protein
MVSRKLTAGGEVVSYCTKCRMDLNHRIIALVEGVPVKVECESCGSHHKYRRPMEDRTADKRVRATPAASRPKTPSIRSAAGRVAAEAAEEANRERAWQGRIAGKMADEFVKYSPKGSFEADSLVHHFKFGDGYVVRVIDANKIEVMFQDGPKVLAQAI